MRHYLVFKDQTRTGVNAPYSQKAVEVSTPRQGMLGIGQAPRRKLQRISYPPKRNRRARRFPTSTTSNPEIRLRNRMHPWNIGHLRRFRR